MSPSSMPRIITILAALALPGAAFAQTSSPTATPPMAPIPAAPPTSGTPALSASKSAEVEQHIQQLHDQLGITPAEEPQWKQYAQVMLANAGSMEQAMMTRGSKVATMNAADNMASYAQLAQVHAANMQKLASSFQTLYNTFPDPQKKIADDVFRETMGKSKHSKH